MLYGSETCALAILLSYSTALRRPTRPRNRQANIVGAKRRAFHIVQQIALDIGARLRRSAKPTHPTTAHAGRGPIPTTRPANIKGGTNYVQPRK